MANKGGDRWTCWVRQPNRLKMRSSAYELGHEMERNFCSQGGWRVPALVRRWRVRGQVGGVHIFHEPDDGGAWHYKYILQLAAAGSNESIAVPQYWQSR